MSLTIFPQAFSVGFSPQYQSAKPPAQGTADPPQIAVNGQVPAGEPAKLNTVKIISDDNDVSSDSTGLAGSKNKTRVRVDPESQKLVIEVVDEKTGEEVRQIPGEQRLRLSKGISEYNNAAFNHEQTDSEQPDSARPAQDRPA